MVPGVVVPGVHHRRPTLAAEDLVDPEPADQGAPVARACSSGFLIFTIFLSLFLYYCYYAIAVVLMVMNHLLNLIVITINIISALIMFTLAGVIAVIIVIVFFFQFLLLLVRRGSRPLRAARSRRARRLRRVVRQLPFRASRLVRAVRGSSSAPMAEPPGSRRSARPRARSAPCAGAPTLLDRRLRCWRCSPGSSWRDGRSALQTYSTA